MFFKNLLVYRVVGELPEANEAVFNELLQSKIARECGSQEMVTMGFVNPYTREAEGSLCHISDGFVLLCAKKEERVLPGHVVKDEVEKKVKSIFEKEGRKAGKKERDAIKEEVIVTLLPRSFIKKSFTNFAICRTHGYVLMDCGGFSKAEELLSMTRDALGSLPIRLYQMNSEPEVEMTSWLKAQKTPDGFSALGDCELVDGGSDGGSVKCKEQDLAGDEVQLHLTSGKTVKQLALSWGEKLSFALRSDLSFKKIKFSDVLADEAAQSGDDRLSTWDASFVIGMRTFMEFLPCIETAFGGMKAENGANKS